MTNKYLSVFTVLVGLFFVINSVASSDFDLSKITLLTVLPIIIGSVLILFSVTSLFRQRGNSKKH